MLIDLSRDQGEWFPFQQSHIDPITGEPIFDPPASEAAVQVRSLAPFYEARIAKRERKVEHVYNPKTRAMERISYIEELSPAAARAEAEDAFDYAITGLKGFEDSRTGEELKCDRATKIALMQVPVFDRFIARCFKLLAASGIKEREDTEKN
ncbi:MAG TPA: hypothetical protein PLT63_03515 [Syntrophales bacterium]|nr:hypothetical protein [Syntrophales bacterium]